MVVVVPKPHDRDVTSATYQEPTLRFQAGVFETTPPQEHLRRSSVLCFGLLLDAAT